MLCSGKKVYRTVYNISIDVLHLYISCYIYLRVHRKVIMSRDECRLCLAQEICVILQIAPVILYLGKKV